MMLARFGHTVSPNGRLERRIVAALCAHLKEKGWVPSKVYDGDGSTDVSDAKGAMELIFNLDDARLYFRNEAGREHWVRLVLGNGTDLISDWTYAANGADTFDAAIKSFNSDDWA